MEETPEEQSVIYFALKKKTMPKSTRQVGIFLSAALILLGVFRNYPYGYFAGAVLFVSLMFKKEVFVDESGLLSKYTLFGFRYTDKWAFTEIQYIHSEYNPRMPGAAALHFTKGALSRMVLFEKEHVDAIVEIAKKANPEIYYDEVKNQKGGRDAE